VLKPDDLETQTDLGRVYLSRNETAKATDHFRLATQTTEYRNDADPAAITDYYLAQSLQQQGYDRAALDSYARLLQRLQNAPSSVRDNPEIQFWLSRPELLYAEVGRLREKQGDTAAALAAYGVVAERSPDDLDTRAHMITLLVSLNRRDDAARLAMDTISHTHASPQSLEMLRDVYRGDDQRIISTRRIARSSSHWPTCSSPMARRPKPSRPYPRQ
jgi:tetratricopeptide (TPR) repeat protein